MRGGECDIKRKMYLNKNRFVGSQTHINKKSSNIKKIPCLFPTLLDLLQSYEGSFITTVTISAEHHSVTEDEGNRERMPTQCTHTGLA